LQQTKQSSTYLIRTTKNPERRIIKQWYDKKKYLKQFHQKITDLINAVVVLQT
jgi:protoheme ferro-lyase